MINIKAILLLTVFISMPLSSYAAGDIAAGKLKAAPCAACHGAEGISGTDIWPNLAGQKAGYLIKQMKEFFSYVDEVRPLVHRNKAGLIIIGESSLPQ